MKTAIIGPVFPYRSGVAYCTTRLAEELGADVISLERQYPHILYPGTTDIDESLRAKTPQGARFLLDIVNPITWVRTGLLLRRERYDALVLVWWIWVWAVPFLVMLSLLPKSMRVVLQCHNISEKEPARWKRWLTNMVLRRADVLVVHARTEAEDALARVPEARIVTTFLPVHELGRELVSRPDARKRLGITHANVALFFGHVRPFKGLDIAINAWRQLKSDALLLVAGEAWWKGEEEYRALAAGIENVRMEFRYIPDDEIATYFAASDVVIAPYRTEAQSGVALTAFHFERPVIATNVGGIPEIIEEGANGMLIPPEDPVAVARAVERFFAREDREAMERQAAAAARKYSWTEYGALFAQLVAESR